MHRDGIGPQFSKSEVADDADELLDEIDALLEEQAVLTNFRQKGGQ